MTPEEAYEEITRLGNEYALIAEGYGGVLTIIHPDTQKEEGVYDMIQYKAGKGRHPGAIKEDLLITPNPPTTGKGE